MLLQRCYIAVTDSNLGYLCSHYLTTIVSTSYSHEQLAEIVNLTIISLAFNIISEKSTTFALVFYQRYYDVTDSICIFCHAHAREQAHIPSFGQ